jgi:hypothetical protein
MARYIVYLLLTVFVFVLIGGIVLFSYSSENGNTLGGIIADIFRVGEEDDTIVEKGDDPPSVFSGGGGSSGESSGGSSGGGSGGAKNGCTVKQLGYAFKNIWDIETCNVFEDGICLDKTIECSFEAHNLDVYSGVFKLRIDFFDSDLGSEFAFDSVSKEVSIGSNNFKLITGTIELQSSGENGLANKNIGCSFNTQETPSICI